MEATAATVAVIATIVPAFAESASRPRYITNPPVHLIEPMRLDRDDPAELVEAERDRLAAAGLSF